MKTLTIILTALALSIGLAVAQDTSGNANNGLSSTGATGSGDITGFNAPTHLGPSPTESSKAINMHPVLTPQLGGVFVDGAKYGAQLINPAAPASYGIGEKYLTAPDPRYDVVNESGPAAHRQAGGIKVFTLEF
jgi:hypothetical protein